MNRNSYEHLINELEHEQQVAQKQEEKRKRQQNLFGRVCSVAARGLLIAFVLLGGLGYYVYRTAQREPEFYAAALATPSGNLAESGQDFEQRVLDLQNAARQVGNWEAVFTDDQINGWIAVDLPRKFPDWLPPEITNPRVSFEPDQIRFACRYESGRIGGFVVAKGNAYCTRDVNEIAIRIHSVNAGVLPIPISQLADGITSGLRQAGVPAAWTEIDGDPVALITLPAKVTDAGEDRRVFLEQVLVEEGRLRLQGRTEKRD